MTSLAKANRQLHQLRVFRPHRYRVSHSHTTANNHHDLTFPPTPVAGVSEEAYNEAYAVALERLVLAPRHLSAPASRVAVAIIR